MQESSQRGSFFIRKQDSGRSNRSTYSKIRIHIMKPVFGGSGQENIFVF